MNLLKELANVFSNKGIETKSFYDDESFEYGIYTTYPQHTWGCISVRQLKDTDKLSFRCFKLDTWFSPIKFITSNVEEAKQKLKEIGAI